MKAVANCTCKICGAKFEKVAYRSGHQAAREFEIWAAENIDVCDECRKAEESTRREAADAEAKAAGDWRMDLPKLSGSEKQIAWAEDLRRELTKNMIGFESQLRAANSSNPEAADKLIGTYHATIMMIRDAKYYIDNRNRVGDPNAFIGFAMQSLIADGKAHLDPIACTLIAD